MFWVEIWLFLSTAALFRIGDYLKVINLTLNELRCGDKTGCKK